MAQYSRIFEENFDIVFRHKLHEFLRIIFKSLRIEISGNSCNSRQAFFDRHFQLF